MKKVIFFIICLTSINQYLDAQNWQWAKSAGGNGNDNTSAAVADAYGNIYVVGGFTSNQITFGTTSLTNSCVCSSDLFLVKYDPSGNVIWAKSAGGIGFENASCLVTD